MRDWFATLLPIIWLDNQSPAKYLLKCLPLQAPIKYFCNLQLWLLLLWWLILLIYLQTIFIIVGCSVNKLSYNYEKYSNSRTFLHQTSSSDRPTVVMSKMINLLSYKEKHHYRTSGPEIRECLVFLLYGFKQLYDHQNSCRVLISYSSINR